MNVPGYNNVNSALMQLDYTPSKIIIILPSTINFHICLDDFLKIDFCWSIMNGSIYFLVKVINDFRIYLCKDTTIEWGVCHTNWTAESYMKVVPLTMRGQTVIPLTPHVRQQTFMLIVLNIVKLRQCFEVMSNTNIADNDSWLQKKFGKWIWWAKVSCSWTSINRWRTCW